MIPFPYQTGQLGLAISKANAEEYVAQDLTTFTEVDPNSRITVTSSRCTVAAIARNENAYVYKDFGAGYFSGDVSVNFDFVVTSTGGAGGLWTMVGFSNQVASSSSWTNAMYTNYFQTGSVLRTIELDSSVAYLDTFAISLTTTYYCRIVRDESVGANGTLYVYVASSNANRLSGAWLDTMSIALKDKEDYRYLYVTTSINTGSSGLTISGYVENIELKRSV